MGGFNIGGSDERHSKHAVERLTAIIGKEQANIVIAGALHLNGAMIAAAQRNEDGSYTDHGNLVLRVGEFFWQHIHDYDNGHTLAASYSHAFGKKAATEGQVDGKGIWTAAGSFGGRDEDGLSKATIGKGDVTVSGEPIPGSVNRNVNQAQTIETNYDVKQIKPYFTNLDTGALWSSLPRDKDGNLNFGASVTGIFDTVKYYTIDPVAKFFSAPQGTQTSEATKADVKTEDDKETSKEPEVKHSVKDEEKQPEKKEKPKTRKEKITAARERTIKAQRIRDIIEARKSSTSENMLYDEPIGPQPLYGPPTPLDAAQLKAYQEIDKQSISATQKELEKQKFTAAFKEFTSLSSAQQKILLQALHNAGKNEEDHSLLSRIRDAIVPKAEAATFVLPLAAGEGAIAACTAATGGACAVALLAAGATVYVGYKGYQEYKAWNDDSILEKSWNKEQKKQKVTVGLSGESSPGSPGDWDPDDHKEWEVKDYDNSKLHNKYGRIDRDPKAVSEDGKRLWWSKDTAGHGGSEWKLFEETDKGLKWYKDVDKYGNYIKGKHKSEVGEFIPWKELRGISVKK